MSTQPNFGDALATLVPVTCSKTTIARNNQIQHLSTSQEPLDPSACNQFQRVASKEKKDGWMLGKGASDH